MSDYTKIMKKLWYSTNISSKTLKRNERLCFKLISKRKSYQMKLLNAQVVDENKTRHSNTQRITNSHTNTHKKTKGYIYNTKKHTYT